jgi:hypothetical protein
MAILLSKRSLYNGGSKQRTLEKSLKLGFVRLSAFAAFLFITNKKPIFALTCSRLERYFTGPTPAASQDYLTQAQTYLPFSQNVIFKGWLNRLPILFWYFYLCICTALRLSDAAPVKLMDPVPDPVPDLVPDLVPTFTFELYMCGDVV